jgi:phosphoglycolate phosphatase
MRTVIFDLDGTLADTSKDLIAAANVCFDAMGHGAVLDPVADARIAFQGGRAMLTEGLVRIHGTADPDLIEKFFPVLLEAYADNIDTHTELYPGAMEAVEVLRAEGIAVGICTNKPEALAETLLRRLGVRAAFGSVIGADTLPVRKPDPAPFFEAVDRAGGDRSRSVLVGDTVTDRSTATAAGVPAILVTFGPNGEDVRGLRPDALLAHFDHLPKIVRDLLE